MLITNGEPDTRRRVSPVPREGVGNLLFDTKEQGAFFLPYDMLQNYTAMTMLANSEFIALLKQADVDSAELSKVAGIPEAQLRYVNHAPSGTGLIRHGSIIVPFDNRNKNDGSDPIYALFNTNPHEKAAERRKETVDYK